MRIEEYLSRSARDAPDKAALVVGDARLTYAELDTASERLASALAKGGVSRGDRVIIFAGNEQEAVVGIFAAAKAGAVFVLVSALATADRLALIARDCRPAALIVAGDLLPVATAALAQAPPVPCRIVSRRLGVPGEDGVIRYDDAVAGETGERRSAGADLDLAALVYTSGSTGVPKGVMLTHGNIAFAAVSVMRYLENTKDDVILSALPISSSYGMHQVLTSVMAGATLVLERSFAFPQAVFAKMAAERVTGLPIVPTIVASMLRMRHLSERSCPSLRYITTASAPLPPSQALRLQALFPRVRIYSMYGMTECKRISYLPPEHLLARPDSVGIPIPGTEAWVVDEAGRRLGPGDAGELVVRGPHLMRGYWGDAAATERTLRPGPYPWEKVLRTGDIFRTDEAGFLYFVARKDDVFKSRGEKVIPKRIEDVLHELDGISEATVVGVPDPVLGAAVKAIIVLAPQARVTARDVIRHCARRLEPFLVPKHVEFRADLPKTDTGKISRRLAAQTAGTDGHGGSGHG